MWDYYIPILISVMICICNNCEKLICILFISIRHSEQELKPNRALINPAPPTIMFNLREPSLKEIEDVIKATRSTSALLRWHLWRTWQGEGGKLLTSGGVIRDCGSQKKKIQRSLTNQRNKTNKSLPHENSWNMFAIFMTCCYYSSTIFQPGYHLQNPFSHLYRGNSSVEQWV